MKRNYKKEGKKLARYRWGDRFVVSIFPVKNDKLHRVTIFFQGKEYYFGSVDRMKALDAAFDLIRSK